MIYQWVDGYRGSGKVPAQKAGKALEAIRAKHRGKLTPAAVVEASRSKIAPLHACFEWDDRRCGKFHRETQAREIIRAVLIVDEPESKGRVKGPVRAYVHVELPDGPGYTTTARAMSKSELREQVLRDAVGELKAWQSRYSRLQELGRVYSAIEEIEKGINRRGQLQLKKAA